MKNLQKIELRIVKFCNRIGQGIFDVPLRFISSIRFLAALWLMLVVFLIIANPGIIADFLKAIFIVAVLHFGITEGTFKHGMKKFFQKRLRPYLAFPNDVVPIGRKFSDGSFPSSHMATTAAMLFVIVSFYPSLFWIAIVFTLIMAFTRLHNGMHYPVDVIAGTMLGLLYGWIAMLIVR